jgi:hypothetical protein
MSQAPQDPDDFDAGRLESDDLGDLDAVDLEDLDAEDLDSVEEPFDEVYDGEVDPDIAAARELSEGREEDALTTDELRPEQDMTEFDAPDAPSTPTALGETPFDEATEETIEDRLAQEEPEERP